MHWFKLTEITQYLKLLEKDGLGKTMAKYWRHTFGKLLWQKMIVKLNIGTCQFVNYVRACSDCILAKPPFLGKIAVLQNLEDVVMDK